MKNKRTYKVVKLEKPWTSWGENKYYGIAEYRGGELVEIHGQDYAHNAHATVEDAEKYIEEVYSKYYLSDYADDEINEFFDNIPWNTLYETTNKLVGMDLKYTVTRTKKEYFEIESAENLVDFFPILGCAWKKFKVETFNASITVDKKTGKLFIWGNLHFAYEHLDYGSNGANILDFTYSAEEGWKIMTAIERRAKSDARCYDDEED